VTVSPSLTDALIYYFALLLHRFRTTDRTDERLVRWCKRGFVRTGWFANQAAQSSIHLCAPFAVQRFNAYGSHRVSRKLSRLSERAKRGKASARLFVRCADCDVEFVVANLAQHVALPQIATEFAAPAPIQDPHFPTGVNRMQRRVEHFHKRIFCIRVIACPPCFCLLRGHRG
jgi:hypothetical protein